ncbi:MAG: hypothetical protein AB2L24_00225 [Mangrovibacterium sp.]
MRKLTMERIILEVDNRTAKKWRYITQQQQKQITRILSQALELLENKDNAGKKQPIGYGQPSEEMMKDLLAENRKEWPEYKKLLDKGREEAKANGLTEEILNKLLAEDD